MDFEWDEEKAASNLRKHGVSFALGMRVFEDPRRFEQRDWFDEYGEDRYLAVGLVFGREIALVFTHRAGKIRLISARRADRHERNNYWQNS